jgi:putative transposase
LGEEMKINRTYKYRLLPTSSQQIQLEKHASVFTFLYNGFLSYSYHYYQKHHRLLQIREMFQVMAAIKKRYPETSSVTPKLVSSLIVHLFTELKTVNKEEWLVKKEKESFLLLDGFVLNQETNTISIPQLGDLSYVNSRIMNGKIKTILFQKKFDKWYLSVTFEHSVPSQTNKSIRYVGIDVGLKEFAIFSTGKIISNPRFYRSLEEKLKKEQRKLSRKHKGSANWNKQLKKVQQIHEQIYHSRMNFLHKLTTAIVRSYDVIGIEKLSIQTMVRNRKMSKSILDASWATFVKLLKYKADEHHKTVIEVDRFYPSSKLCSRCGNKQIMPLHLRTFVCNSCHATIDRDYNASKNIENKAREMISFY